MMEVERIVEKSESRIRDREESFGEGKRKVKKGRKRRRKSILLVVSCLKALSCFPVDTLVTVPLKCWR